MLEGITFAGTKQSVTFHLCQNKSGGGQVKARCRDEGIQKGTFNNTGWKNPAFFMPAGNLSHQSPFVKFKKKTGYFWSHTPKLSNMVYPDFKYQLLTYQFADDSLQALKL